MADYSIRLASKSDLELLPSLEKRGDESFRSFPRFTPMLEMEGLTIEECHNLPPSSQIWIAETNRPVGFVFTRDIDDLTYFGQLSVVPEAQGIGIGTALLGMAVNKARADNKPGLVLITYADVPFNAPFYKARGFLTLAPKKMGPELLDLVDEDEKQWGRFSPRVVMGKFFEN